MGALNIEWTYQLICRELPDGTVQLPPIVKGMFTYTKESRNFSVECQDNHDQFYSECYVARYTLTDKEYSETAEYLIADDQIRCKSINYDLSRSMPNQSCFMVGHESDLHSLSLSRSRSPSQWNLKDKNSHLQHRINSKITGKWLHGRAGMINEL